MDWFCCVSRWSTTGLDGLFCVVGGAVSVVAFVVMVGKKLKTENEDKNKTTPGYPGVVCTQQQRRINPEAFLVNGAYSE